MGPAIEEPEEKVIPQLAITYGVLRRIGHSEETVEECLRSISGVDLQQAYEWVRYACWSFVEAHQLISDAAAPSSLGRGLTMASR